MTQRASPSLRFKAFADLHGAGWPDTSIAAVTRSAPSGVRKWRETNQLPPNPSRCIKIEDAEARKMHADGANDQMIADRFGVLPSGVCHWRRRNRLAPNVPAPAGLSDEQKRKARKMLRLGASRRQIANAFGRSDLSCIQRLRAGMKDPGLRRTGITNRTIKAQVLKDRGIQARITRAIGAAMPMDVRLDAVSEMYVDVLDGRLARTQIEAQAPSYRNRAFEMCGSKFGALRLDEESDEGWSLMERLEDHDALERMDRAAEAAFENDNWPDDEDRDGFG